MIDFIRNNKKVSNNNNTNNRNGNGNGNGNNKGIAEGQ